MSSAYLRQTMKENLKSLQRYSPEKAKRKKLIRKIAKKSEVIMIGDIRVCFQAKEVSELQ